MGSGWGVGRRPQGRKHLENSVWILQFLQAYLLKSASFCHYSTTPALPPADGETGPERSRDLVRVLRVGLPVHRFFCHRSLPLLQVPQIQVHFYLRLFLAYESPQGNSSEQGTTQLQFSPLPSGLSVSPRTSTTNQIPRL